MYAIAEALADTILRGAYLALALALLILPLVLLWLWYSRGARVGRSIAPCLSAQG
jgi:hypothetical protein